MKYCVFVSQAAVCVCHLVCVCESECPIFLCVGRGSTHRISIYFSRLWHFLIRNLGWSKQRETKNALLVCNLSCLTNVITIFLLLFDFDFSLFGVFLFFISFCFYFDSNFFLVMHLSGVRIHEYVIFHFYWGVLLSTAVNGQNYKIKRTIFLYEAASNSIGFCLIKWEYIFFNKLFNIFNGILCASFFSRYFVW